MAVVARVLPRLWDGRRLLQFLTGMALIALAFATPALSSSPEVPDPPAIVTVVDAPTGGVTAGATDQVLSPQATDELCDESSADAAELGEELLGAEPIGAESPLPGSAQRDAHSGRAPPA